MALLKYVDIVPLELIALAVMPWMDDVRILECSTSEILGLDIYTELKECARRKIEHRTKLFETENIHSCRRVNLLVKVIQP